MRQHFDSSRKFTIVSIWGHLDSSIPRHKKQANKNGTAVTVGSKGGISADIRFRPNVQSIFRALSVSSPAINIK